MASGGRGVEVRDNMQVCTTTAGTAARVNKPLRRDSVHSAAAVGQM